MLHSLITILFFILNFLGVVLIYAGLFLYEDEEKQFQNKIEEWWIRVSDKHKASRSKVAAFMQEIARSTGTGFDRLFGQRLFSLRVIPVSIYLSLASAFLLILVTQTRAKYTPGTSRQGAIVLLVYFLALALVPAFFKNRLVLALWWSIIPAALLSISGFLFFVFRTRGVRATFYGIGLVALVFISSLLCDLLYITLTRHILRRIIGIDRIPEILLMICLNLLALVIPLYGPIYIGLAVYKYAPQAGSMVVVSLLFNFINFIAGFAAFFLSLLLLLHRLFWPAIQRPLYAIYRFSPIKEKRWLFSLGIALLLLPHQFTIETLKAILEKL